MTDLVAVWKANSRNAHLYVPAPFMFHWRQGSKLMIRIEAFLTTRGQKNLAALVPGGSGHNQAQGHVGNANGTQNAQVTNAEVDQIVNESRRAGAATPPIQPQPQAYSQPGQQQYQQGQAQQPYQARVKGQR